MQEFIRKDWRKELLYYVNLIRAYKKVLYQTVFNKPVGPKNVKKWFVYYVISWFCNSLLLELQLPKKPLPRQKLSF